MTDTTDPSYRYATTVVETDGTDKVYDLGFKLGYIAGDDVLAVSGIEDPDTKLLTDVTPHTVSFIDVPAGNRVKVSPVPATKRKLMLFRQTDIAALLVKFSDGKLQTGRNMDLSATQLLMAIQEILDGLRNNKQIVEAQIGTVVDLNKIIQEIYKEVIELLASGGIVSVDPRVWNGKWEGDTLDDEEFPMPGADVSGAGFYDVYVDGLGLEPDVDYEVIMGETSADTVIRFKVAHPGKLWFAVLRGYAKPYTGPPPITGTDLRVKIIESDGPVFIANGSAEYGLVRCNAAATEVRVQEIPSIGPSETKMGSGSYMSFVQKGGVVTIVPASSNVTLDVPAGCLPKTRAVNSTISITCEFGDGNVWLVSGDLAKE